MKAIRWSYTNCYLQVDWQGKNDIPMKLTIRSLDGIHQIAELFGQAAEVLRTLSSRHNLYCLLHQPFTTYSRWSRVVENVSH